MVVGMLLLLVFLVSLRCPVNLPDLPMFMRTDYCDGSSWFLIILFGKNIYPQFLMNNLGSIQIQILTSSGLI